MKAIIIDDEEKARGLLRVLIGENCPEITQVEEAADLPGGVAMINDFDPQIVFLDIEMPGYSGLQILEFFSIDKINFEIIFTTAYSEFAVNAFQLNAVDYLLKPLRDDQVANAVHKAIEQRGRSQLNERLTELKNTLKDSKVRKIGLPVSNGVLFVKFDNIILLEADRMYTKVFTLDDGEILVSKPMKFFGNLLNIASEFYQPHRSFLINLKYIKQYVNQDGGYIIMDNQKNVSISREKREEFFEIMQRV